MIQSRYPFIAVETSEEDRLERTLSQVAGDLSGRFFVWTVTNGQHRYCQPNAIYDTPRRRWRASAWTSRPPSATTAASS
ncbi:MAG: hypothetical protein DMD84_00755 [Candidatus Rokuibacteriota bacterium]|nr:MAG: hypothetical protein DMD84_00755 [Candidatus Rokubacteria bacterium]